MVEDDDDEDECDEEGDEEEDDEDEENDIDEESNAETETPAEAPSLAAIGDEKKYAHVNPALLERLRQKRLREHQPGLRRSA